MMPRRLSAAFVVFAVFAAVGRAGQGVKIAGDPAPGGPPPPAAGAPPTSDGRAPAPRAAGAASAPAETSEAPAKEATKTKKKGAKAKKKKHAESKYKTRKLSEGAENHYRFDEEANPIGGAAKKKPAAKPACADGDSCTDKDKKSSDADAL